jgi:hypothetical protein
MNVMGILTSHRMILLILTHMKTGKSSRLNQGDKNQQKE